MKKIIYILLLLPFITLFSGCNDLEEIVFDHELQQFPTKENAILLEVIMPKGSIADDEYYIIGDFNGGTDAIGNPEWRLEKAPGSNIKWGIYLIPSSFQNGKTLADGFTFYAKKQGAERSVKGEAVVHTLDVTVGSFTNVWVDRWESYFGEPEKDSYSIYVNDQTGWDELALYVWGDLEVAGWPGILPTGSEEINGVTYTVFDMGKEAKDATLNFIFNNNNKGKQFDAMQGFTLDRDVYIIITESSYEEVDPNVTPYNGYTIYVDNQTGWDALALYAWGDAEPAGWPGLQPTGTKEINGINYIYFQMGEEMNDKSLNLIFNNNGNNIQLPDIPVVLNRDFYFQITSSGGVEVDPEGGPEGYKIYIENNSGWDALALYYWGEGVADPGWPGLAPSGTEEVNGKTYLSFELPSDINGKTINLIFNNNGAGIQFDGPSITIDKDFYFSITAESATEVDPNTEQGHIVYVADNSGWDALALYYWGDGVADPGWPGLAPAGTKEVGGVTYKYFELPAAVNDKSLNLIFNNNGAGAQFDGPTIVANKNYYYQITATAYMVVTP
jgi:hypothetical protein